jgi:type I restriction enzyme M protein
VDEVRGHGHVLTPGRYVGAEAQEDDGEQFDAKLARLSSMLRDQFAEADKLEELILGKLNELSYGG